MKCPECKSQRCSSNHGKIKCHKCGYTNETRKVEDTVSTKDIRDFYKKYFTDEPAGV